jgi:hypothetical protein
MRRNAEQRAAACLLALLAQAGLIALFMQKRAPAIAHVDNVQYLVFIQSSPPPKAPPPPTAKLARTRASISVIEQVTPDLTIEAEGPTPSVAAPPDAASHIDWIGNLRRDARAAGEAAEERELHGDPLHSKPEVLIIPERPHQAGDEERYDDGAVLTWLNERCYVLLDPASYGPNPVKNCKNRTLAEKRAAANRREQENAMMPKYLRKPLPVPSSPQRRKQPPESLPQ